MIFSHQTLNRYLTGKEKGGKGAPSPKHRRRENEKSVDLFANILYKTLLIYPFIMYVEIKETQHIVVKPQWGEPPRGKLRYPQDCR